MQKDPGQVIANARCTGASLEDVIGQLSLMDVLIAAPSPLVGVLKESNRERYISRGRVDTRGLGNAPLTTFGTTIAWALLLCVILMGLSLVLSTIL